MLSFSQGKYIQFFPFFFFLTRFFLSFSGDTLVLTCLFLNCCYVKTRKISSTKTGCSISHGNMKYIFILDFVNDNSNKGNNNNI